MMAPPRRRIDQALCPRGRRSTKVASPGEGRPGDPSGRGEDRRTRAPALSVWASLEPANRAEVEKWAETNANPWQVRSQAEIAISFRLRSRWWVPDASPGRASFPSRSETPHVVSAAGSACPSNGAVVELNFGSRDCWRRTAGTIVIRADGRSLCCAASREPVVLRLHRSMTLHACKGVSGATSPGRLTGGGERC